MIICHRATNRVSKALFFRVAQAATALIVCMHSWRNILVCKMLETFRVSHSQYLLATTNPLKHTLRRRIGTHKKCHSRRVLLGLLELSYQDIRVLVALLVFSFTSRVFLFDKWTFVYANDIVKNGKPFPLRFSSYVEYLGRVCLGVHKTWKREREWARKGFVRSPFCFLPL